MSNSRLPHAETEVFVNEYPGVSALIGGSVVFNALAAHTVYAASRTDRPAETPSLISS